MPANTFGLHCNCNLYDIHLFKNDEATRRSLMPVLNSTLVGLFKTFYGRYAGTEGNLKTEVVDALMMEIPNPTLPTPGLVERLEKPFRSIQQRPVTHLLEDAFRECRTTEEVRRLAELPLGLPPELEQGDRRELDDAVFELLGVESTRRRGELVDRLYREITLHNRGIRIIEVQKMEQRRRGASAAVSQLELALDAWEELEPEWKLPLPKWLDLETGKAKVIDLPAGDVRLPAAENFFEATTLYFGKKTGLNLVCASRAEAEVLFIVATEGVRGPISIPATESECEQLRFMLEQRLTEGRRRLMKLAEERAGTDKLREQVVDTLYRWFIHGPPEPLAASAAG